MLKILVSVMELGRFTAKYAPGRTLEPLLGIMLYAESGKQWRIKRACRKKAAGVACRFINQKSVYFPRFTAFFSSAPAVNFATRRAAILMVAPVCGFRPLRAFLCEMEKVPKPISATRSPFFNAPVMLSMAVSMALPACTLLMPAPDAIRSIKSALFIALSLSWQGPTSLAQGKVYFRRGGNPAALFSSAIG